MSAILVKVQGYDTYVDILSGRTVLQILKRNEPVPGGEPRDMYHIISGLASEGYAVLAVYPTENEARKRLREMIATMSDKMSQWPQGILVLHDNILPEVKSGE